MLRRLPPNSQWLFVFLCCVVTTLGIAPHELFRDHLTNSTGEESAADSVHIHDTIRFAEVDEPSSLAQGDLPFALDAEHWWSSANVSFHANHVEIPLGGWIRSKATLERPTVVESEMRSSGKSGPIAMMVFVKAEEDETNDPYLIKTGTGDWHDELRLLPGDLRMIVGYNNDADHWDMVKFQLGAENIQVFFNEVMVQNDTDTSLFEGAVEFKALKEPMMVRGVRWRRDCKFSSWMNGRCSVTCGDGAQISKRLQVLSALFGGRCEGGTERVRHCSKGECPE
eukprot:TRINITY_DN1498_c0_g1_i1.p1 TRINITY_DN1498_c0_g1~~TRINITY_DN1498_c0_g1_i1.p1  ORF type:complete len:282 (+),score=49.11 TRINITY_DN1498_c0_g1_i1:64-909(+)